METYTNRTRQLILEMSCHSGHGHLGGSLSCVEIIWNIFNHMKADDVFILSKGHAAQTLYAILAIKGIIPMGELGTFCQKGSRLLGHPTTDIPVVKVNTGSLGNGLGVAVGLAYSKKLKNESGRVFVLISDGELYEGSTWEAIHHAPELLLNNLIVVIDYNNQTVLKEINDSYLVMKLASFYWTARMVDGHGKFSLHNNSSYPLAVVAKTVKSKGISFAEGKPGYHQGLHSPEEIIKARKELGLS